MEFLRKAWRWLQDPRVALWFCGFFTYASLQAMEDGKPWWAAAYGACAVIDAFASLRRLQVTQ